MLLPVDLTARRRTDISELYVGRKLVVRCAGRDHHLAVELSLARLIPAQQPRSGELRGPHRGLPGSPFRRHQRLGGCQIIERDIDRVLLRSPWGDALGYSMAMPAVAV